MTPNSADKGGRGSRLRLPDYVMVAAGGQQINDGQAVPRGSKARQALAPWRGCVEGGEAKDGQHGEFSPPDTTARLHKMCWGCGPLRPLHPLRVQGAP
eukprot:262130-Chlamydomonas_euryale.AAC.2